MDLRVPRFLAIALFLTGVATAAPADVAAPWSARYALVDKFGPPFFCDPDKWPVPRPELPKAQEWYAQADTSSPELAAIFGRLGVTSPANRLTDAELLAVYQEHKLLGAITLEPSGEDWTFSMRTGKVGEKGEELSGVVTAAGEITVRQRSEVWNACGKCLARGTRIATPRGDVAVEELSPGMPVWTLDRAGRKVPATVARVARVAAGATHEVLEMELGNGRTLRVSPGHPLVTDATLGSVAPGAELGGVAVLSSRRVRYVEAFTYDLEPSGDTGFYLAEGVALASTIRR